jgi:hypothetical protein
MITLPLVDLRICDTSLWYPEWLFSAASTD